jgi:large subunit ribosomal protein L1
MMPLVGRVGSILKQKMPNPKAGTVTPNIAQVVKDIKGAARAEYRVEKAGIIHCPIGKASFTVEQLQANLLTLLNALIKAKPAAAKGRYLKRITVCSSMGPGIGVDVTLAQKAAERV